MRSNDLDTVKENYRFFIDEFGKLPLSLSLDAEYCRLLAQASDQHRRLAIAILLSEADRRQFSDHLRKSGNLRVVLLEKAAGQPGKFPKWERQGLVAPFFDGWVGGADDVARRIAELSALPYQPDYEYLEDYHHARWWYAVALAGWQVTAGLDEVFGELREATANDEDPRVLVCRALMSRDAELFDEAMQALTAQHIEWYEERTADPAENCTEGYLFMEGVAVVRLARHLGMSTGTEYPRVPGLALLGAQGA